MSLSRRQDLIELAMHEINKALDEMGNDKCDTDIVEGYLLAALENVRAAGGDRPE